MKVTTLAGKSGISGYKDGKIEESLFCYPRGICLDKEGNLLDDAYNNRAQAFLDELIWMSRTLRWGRRNLPSKYHQA